MKGKHAVVIVILCLVLVSFAGTAGAGGLLDSWDTTDKIMLGSLGVLWFLDWGQTRDIARQPNRYYETNPILGRHPSVQEVDIYFVGAGILGFYVADLVGKKAGSFPRKLLLMVWIVNQARLVSNNEDLGLKASFNLWTF